MQIKSKRGLTVLTECSIMIALATVLSVIKLLELPYGGSITVASMLPIVIISQRHGTAIGLASATATAALQLLLGLNTLSYVTTWYSVVTVIFLDYVIAFAVFGLSAVFKKKIRNQALSMFTGTLTASILRYVCHVISGATVWAGLSIPDSAALIYSVGYNATYMIPESIVLLLATLYVGSCIDFMKRIPTPIAREKLNTGATVFTLSAGFIALGALAADTALVFSKLQSADTGDFTISGLADVNWTAVLIITLASAAACAALFFAARAVQRKQR